MFKFRVKKCLTYYNACDEDDLTGDHRSGPYESHTAERLPVGRETNITISNTTAFDINVYLVVVALLSDRPSGKSYRLIY